MSLAIFYCLSTLLLFLVFFTYTSTYFARRKQKFIHMIQVEMVKTHLENAYNMNTFKDSVHQ